MRTSLLLTAALLVYLVVLGQRGVLLLRSGTPAGVVLGTAVLVLPLIGAWIVWATWRFGLRVDRLTRRLAEEDGLPDTSSLPRRPSGRVDRAAADGWFEQRRAEVAAAPGDWRAWYRLAHGYDVAGDRRRAREAMRQAVELAVTAGRGSTPGTSTTR